ncbi:MAG: EAL domain-containing protein [Steroidobacteraceae bacterium]
MTRRLALVLGTVAALALGMGMLQGWQTLRQSLALQAEQNLSLLARSQATTIGTRLAVAATLVQSLGRAEMISGAGEVHERSLGNAVLPGMLSTTVATIERGDPHLPLKLGGNDLQSLRNGLTLVRFATAGQARGALYLVRQLAGGDGRIAFYEVSSDWLWEGITLTGAAQARVAVLDGFGALMRYGDRPDNDLQFLFARERDYSGQGSHGAITLRAWQLNDSALRGAVTRIAVQPAGLSAPDWILIAYQPQQEGLLAWQQLSVGLPWQLLAGLLIVLIAAYALRSRWAPLLAELRHGLRQLADGHLDPIELGDAADEPRLVGMEFNQAVAALAERLKVQAALAEVDRRLLAAGEFEQSLDAVLMAVRQITRSHGTVLALLDRDAPNHARCYYSIGVGGSSGVNRTVLDGHWLECLAENRDGVTIARWEPDRHVFLESLDEAGAGFYWVWPVMRHEQLVAILAVGYPDMPVLQPEIADNGRECARRIAVALSNSARDEQLYRQAHFDALTALPNRLLFRDRLAQELANASSGLSRGALLYVDLDHFKKINDSVGHAAGDQLLVIVAQRLRSCVKEGDTVARLAGDEFTVILHSIQSPDDAAHVAQRIIAALQMPVHLAGRDHYVRASIGITVFPDDGASIEELMRNADLAMYQAKDGGRSRAVFYSAQLARLQAPVAQSGLYRALRRREFALYYQPQYALTDGALVGVEALLRWQSPRDGLRYPGEFVPAAEESGVIIDIGAWVLESACNQFAIWREQGIAPPRLSLNLSVQQLLQPDFPQLVRRALDRVGLPPEVLELELAEPMLVEQEVRDRLRALASLGVSIALDDFGIDNAALNHLRLSQVHTIKIDRTLLLEVNSNAGAATLAQSVISMAHALGKRVVAEGVESIEQLSFLREHDCDAAQGFFLAQPRSGADTTELLSAGQQSPELLRQQQAG